MTVSNQPTNFNYLSPLGYKLVLSRAPNIQFFTQQVSLPEISLPSTTTPTPFININHPGDHLQFGQLEVTFRINENLDNYLEIYNWIVALGTPERFTQYTLVDRALRSNDKEIGTTLSDISLVMLTSAMNFNVEFTLRDCFPVSLSGITTDSTLSDVEYLVATATFGLKDFTVNRI